MNEGNIPQGSSDWLKTYNLALTDRVSCDTVGCEYPATLYAKVKCCNAVVLGCLECMEKSYRVIAVRKATGSPVMCRVCGEANNPNNWLTLPQEI